MSVPNIGDVLSLIPGIETSIKKCESNPSIIADQLTKIDRR